MAAYRIAWVSIVSLSRLTMAYHVIAPGRVLDDFLGLRFVWACDLSILQTDTCHARVLDMTELVGVRHGLVWVGYFG